jgi:hypothetical protein
MSVQALFLWQKARAPQWLMIVMAMAPCHIRLLSCRQHHIVPQGAAAADRFQRIQQQVRQVRLWTAAAPVQ